MTLNTERAKFLRVDESMSFPAYDTTVVIGKGVMLLSTGKVILTSAQTKTFALAMETPAAADDLVTVVLRGIVEVNSTAATSDTYIADNEYTNIVVGGPVYMDATGKIRSDNTSAILVGTCINKVNAASVTTYGRIAYMLKSPINTVAGA